MTPSSGNDRYEILRLLGAGGMGNVYIARDRIDNKQVALKAVVGNVGTPVYLDREFDILAGLSHPNIVRVFEKFRLKGQLFFAMEKIDGVPFMEAIGTPCGQALTALALRAFGQLLDAIEYLHDSQVIHAELSPGNLLIDEFGVLRIVDFEHCRRPGVDESEYWPEGTIVGTPLYMSPEHLTGRLVPESDYFVVGTLVFEALTGRNPFLGRDFGDVLQRISHVDSSVIMGLQSQPIDSDLQHILKLLFAPDTHTRASGWELLRALTRHYVPFDPTTQTSDIPRVAGKPKAFLSHTSADKQIARRLALELAKAGVDVWLDEWAIRVGESISRQIDDALRDCRYLILLLSPAAVQSKWVEKEWRAAFWREAESGNVVILPVVATKCEIPPLLSDKKYADLSKSFGDGVRELVKCFGADGI